MEGSYVSIDSKYIVTYFINIQTYIQTYFTNIYTLLLIFNLPFVLKFSLILPLNFGRNGLGINNSV